MPKALSVGQYYYYTFMNTGEITNDKMAGWMKKFGSLFFMISRSKLSPTRYIITVSRSAEYPSLATRTNLNE